MKKAGRRRKTTGALTTALLVMLLIFGAGIVLYPTLSDWYNRTHASQTITDYNRLVEQQTEQEKERLWSEAEAYNAQLSQETIEKGGTINFVNITEEQERAYQNELKVAEEGFMGYVTIPEVDVHLPVYHGIDEKVLQTASGHLEGSSLPVGGTSTHCVLTGHTGLPSARLFTDIDKLELGDTFRLTILGQTLTYEVSEIRVVLPTDVDSLRIEEGQDLCTLLTCTPYGINDHRLLVTGTRVVTQESPGTAGEETDTKEQEGSGLTLASLRRLSRYRPLILMAVILTVVITAGVQIGMRLESGGRGRSGGKKKDLQDSGRPDGQPQHGQPQDEQDSGSTGEGSWHSVWNDVIIEEGGALEDDPEEDTDIDAEDGTDDAEDDDRRDR